jgi:hypothetical protein
MKSAAILLATVVLLNSLTAAQSSAPPAEPSIPAAAIRTEVRRRGVGEKSRVKVSLRDASEVKAYISKIDDSAFEVTDKKSGISKFIAYGDVRKVQGPGLSSGVKIGIVVGVVALAILISYAAAFVRLGNIA